MSGLMTIALLTSGLNAEILRDNKNNTVYDSDTGLLWQDYHKYGNWEGAIDYCNNLVLAGYDDWRLPTIDELEVLGDKRLQFKELKQNRSVWSSHSIFQHQFGGFITPKQDATYSYDFEDKRRAPCKLSYLESIRCVRSGLSNSQIVDLKKQIKQEELDAKLEAERERLKAQREQDAYEAKLAKFRKNIREGDDTSSGLIIQVKGNMVKVQTNDSQCSQRDYKGNCSNYINTAVEKWLKRSEIYPN